MKKYYNLLFVIVISILAKAQNPVPAKSQGEPIIIVGGTAHLGNGKVLENSAIVIEGGKVTVVADASTVEKSKTRRSIDARGKHVYPGFINCNSSTGLTEIDLIRSTRDYDE